MYCALSLEFMNLLQNFHLAVIEYLYVNVNANVSVNSKFI